MEPGNLNASVATLAAFLGVKPLTTAIADLEHDLVDSSSEQSAQVAQQSGISDDLLTAALTVRENLGRISDLIHATGIVLALPHILEEGEHICKRPSLAAGNDPSRPFDLETNRRVAEFKLAQWAGADAMRKRQTFKDLVMLAADTSERRADLFVIGDRPGRFLRSSRSTAAWALDRAPAAAATFQERFGPLTMTIGEFTTTHASHVNITDLRTILRPLATPGY